MTKKHTLLALLLFICSCTPTIGNNLELNNANFELGVTHKNTVANTLGLPNAIEKDQAENLEYWFYNEKAELKDLILPIVVAPGYASTMTIPIWAQDKAKAAALICIFDNNILTELRKLK